MSTNILWQKSNINKSERSNQKNQKPYILWFTGYSGSGKSTLANALDSTLYELGYHTYILDGDNLRHGLNSDLGFEKEDREENIRRVGEVAKLFVDSGMIVLASFISPFEKDRQIVKELVDEDEFVEIFVDVDLEICEQRDSKGLYKKVKMGSIKNFTGVDIVYEKPLNPALRIDNSKKPVDENIQIIMNYLKERGYLK